MLNERVLLIEAQDVNHMQTFNSPFLLHLGGDEEIILCVCVALSIKKSLLCTTVSSTQSTYLPPTPTQPYTHACPTATGSSCAYSHTYMKPVSLEEPESGTESNIFFVVA